MPLILGFDTSGPHVSAALVEDGTVLSSRTEEMKRGQAERLMPLLEAVLGEAGRRFADLDAIGVGVGPGNFTGIRISVSAARGLALGLGIPAVGVSTFDATDVDYDKPHIAAVPAPREQAYVLGGEFVDPVLKPLAELDADALVWPPEGDRLTENIAKVALDRFDGDVGRPAPLYIKPADAAPPRDPAPVILDG